ncbi:MAG: hypothetical protein GQ570_08640 [Helicobacteraceae bacterium]|nr:hypothetical protein [Helicobacteraceae bacterium]
MNFFKLLGLSALLTLNLYSAEATEDSVTLAFTNTPISEVIKFVAKSSGVNILLNDNISGNINFISHEPIKSKDLLSFLDNVLRVKGYTLLLNPNGYYEIARVAQAKSHAVLDNKSTIGMTIKIKKLKYMKPSVVSGKIRHLLSQYATITHDDDNSLLIIDDYPDQISNVDKVINALDTRVKRKVEVITLRNYSANSAFKQLEPLLKNSKSLYKHEVTFVPNDYANSIAVFANKEDMAQAVSIVRDFDNQKNLHNVTTKIHFLKNAEAKEVGAMVTKLLTTIDINSPIKTNVSFNEELNAIILAGSQTQIELISGIIVELDIEKRQVFLKGNIYEISENDVDKMGINWGTAAGAITNSGGFALTADIGSAALTGVAGASVIDYLGSIGSGNKGALALGASIEFLKTYGAVNTISEPTLLCANNLKAKIYVGKTQSIKVSSAQQDSTTGIARDTFTRTDIGFTMEMTPRILDNDKVSILFNNIIEDVDRGQDAQTNTPVVTKRSVETTAIVKNGEPIVIGGLVRDVYADTTIKVPLLGDIPILGALFRSNQEYRDKVTLLVVITPYIVNKSADLIAIQQKVADYQELTRKYANLMEKNYEEGFGKKYKSDTKQQQALDNPVLNAN